jgi:hypothetical protein
MQRLPLPPAQDIVRFLRPTVEEIESVLKAYYMRRPGEWNYRPAKAVARPVFSGDLTLSAVLEGCLTRGNPIGRKSNAEVAENIWKIAQGRNFKCYPLKPKLFSIRKDLSFLVDPLFYFVERERVHFFWLQPRRRYSPSMEGLGALSFMIQDTFGQEYDDAELELLDLSVPDGEFERVARVLRFSDLPKFSKEVLNAEMDRFAQAYDRLCEVGVKRPERRRPAEHPATLFDKQQ